MPQPRKPEPRPIDAGGIEPDDDGDSRMTRAEAAKAYRKIARKLGKLQVGASEHISRRDNNQMFEIEHFIRDVSKRIADGYDVLDYPRLLK